MEISIYATDNTHISGIIYCDRNGNVYVKIKEVYYLLTDAKNEPDLLEEDFKYVTDNTHISDISGIICRDRNGNVYLKTKEVYYLLTDAKLTDAKNELDLLEEDFKKKLIL